MNHTKPFNVRMDAVTRHRMDTLCNDNDITGAQLVRALINDRWMTEKEDQPRCASGAPCCMPAVYQNNRGAKMLADLAAVAASANPHGGKELFATQPPPIPTWSPSET